MTRAQTALRLATILGAVLGLTGAGMVVAVMVGGGGR